MGSLIGKTLIGIPNAAELGVEVALIGPKPVVLVSFDEAVDALVLIRIVRTLHLAGLEARVVTNEGHVRVLRGSRRHVARV